LQELGVKVGEGGFMELPCLRWTFGFDEESLLLHLLPHGQEISIVWQILALDYLCAPPSSPLGQMLSFADFSEARTYAGPFENRVLRRLSETVGRDRAQFMACAARCGGVQVSRDPLCYDFRVFPRFQLQVVRHPGDEDFPAVCNLLFPRNTLSMFSVEDAVVAAEMLVSTLQGRGPLD